MLLRKSVPIVIAFIFVVSATILPAAIAQQDQPTSGSGMQLSPTRSEIVGQPGDQKKFSITLKNVTTNKILAEAVLSDFESDGLSGTPKIIVEEREERTPYSLFNMLSGLSNVELEPNETKQLEYTLNIPSDVAPGAYFGALQYAAIPNGQAQPDSDRQVALTASLAHLVLLEVPGDVVEQIQLEDLSAQKGGKASSLFFSAPNEVAVRVKNLGNGFSRPFGQVTVDGFGGRQVSKYELNNTEPRGIILPKSSRAFVDSISNVKVPGRYTINASVAYGNGGEVVNFKSTFWYLPFWFLAILLLTIGGLAAGAYAVYKKRTRPTAKRR